MIVESRPKVRIAINGFGRIGRMVLRCALDDPDVQLVAINAPSLSPEYAVYVIKYDSVHGKYIGDISSNGSDIIIDGQIVKHIQERDPTQIDWKAIGAEYIVESTGKFKTIEAASVHLKSGAKKVIISSPSKDAPTFVYGVNHRSYTPGMNVVSNASCTTNCLAPLAKVIDDKFGIACGILTTVHSVTNSQRIVDSHASRDWRIGRSGVSNVIPTSTGAAQALSKVIPQLDGKLTGIALRVPTSNVSLVDLTVQLNTPAEMKDINNAFKEAALDSSGDLYGVLSYTDEEVVSSDMGGSLYSCTFDSSASTQLNNQFVKLLAWYDNECGYSARILDLIKYMYHFEN
ncbi:glyceraldehyde-3-phosphate dehydrogenase-like protein [Dipodascopsis uninucleata]